MPVSDLQEIVNAVQNAGHVAARYWRKSPETWQKPGEQGPVSEADLAVDAQLKSDLLSARPDYGWLSEETEDDVTRLTKTRSFIVDPIDGTRAYLQGDRTFAHSVAVVENGHVISAAVFLPLRDKLYTAVKGQGAALNGRPIATGTMVQAVGSDILVAKPVMAPENWNGPPPDLSREHRPSLAYRMCLVAEGRFDGMVTLRDAWEWDIAAGALICKEAGTAISDRLGQPLSFNNAHPTQAGVLAGSNGVHRDMLERLQARL